MLLDSTEYEDMTFEGIEIGKSLSEKLLADIKNGCNADREFFDYLVANMDAVFSIDENVCNHIAEMNCKIKYQVVMKDERESGLREILNYGHTVGRAIETVSDYKLLHGHALSIGLVVDYFHDRMRKTKNLQYGDRTQNHGQYKKTYTKI